MYLINNNRLSNNLIDDVNFIQNNFDDNYNYNLNKASVEENYCTFNNLKLFSKQNRNLVSNNSNNNNKNKNNTICKTSKFNSDNIKY